MSDRHADMIAVATTLTVIALLLVMIGWMLS